MDKDLVQIDVTPMALLNSAVEKGADIDQLSKLLDLQERWEKNEAKKAYVVAMAKFRDICPDITKSRAGHNSNYAGLSDTIGTIKESMNECGLSHNWRTDTASGISVTCVLTHIQGHSEETTLSADADKSGSKNDIQALGSTVSYLQRYTLYAILGLASKDQDDDGAGSNETLTEEHLREIETLASEVGVKTTDKVFLRYLKVESIELVLDKYFQDVIAILEKKR